MCSHCGLLGHTIDQCFKLHGKHRPRNPRSGNANQATIVSNNDINHSHTSTNSDAHATLSNILQNVSTTQCQDLVNYFSHQMQPQNVPNDTQLLTPMQASLVVLLAPQVTQVQVKRITQVLDN